MVRTKWAQFIVSIIALSILSAIVFSILNASIFRHDIEVSGYLELVFKWLIIGVIVALSQKIVKVENE